MAPACNASTWRQRHEEQHKSEASQASYYEDPTWKDKIKAKTKMTTSDGNSVRKEEPLHAPEGVSAGTGCLESSGTLVKKRKRELPEESASPSWAYTHVFIAALFTTARKLEQA